MILRVVGLAAIAGSTMVHPAYGRWLAIGGGLWLAGVFGWRAWSERPAPVGRHLFWAAVFIALAAWIAWRMRG